MKIAFRLFFFFFLSTVLFGQMFRMDPVETDPRVKAASDLRRQQHDDEASEGDSGSESDDSGAVQRGAAAGISEEGDSGRRGLPVAFPIDNNNKKLFLQGELQEEKDEAVAAVAISLADIIAYLRENNLLDSPEKYHESVNAFLNQRLEESQELDENEKASIKSQQAKSMADDLERRGEAALVASSLVRQNTLTLLEIGLGNAGSRIKSTSEKHAALLVALREIASSTPQSGRGDAASTAQKGRFLMSRTEAVQANENASTGAPIVSRSMAPSATPSITNTKFALEQNRLALEELLSNDPYQQELLKVIQKKHDEFLLEESISNKAAEAKAKENKEFFNKKIKELEEIKASGRSEVAVHGPIMEQLDKIIQGLRTRSEAYQQLEGTYHNKPNEERTSLLQLLKSEQANTLISDDHIFLRAHGRVRIEEAARVQNIDQQNARDEMMLARVEILERFGPYALDRFDHFFYTEIKDHASIAFGKLKKFVTSEEEKEATRNSGLKSLFLTKDSNGVELLNKIYQRSLDSTYKDSEQEKIDQKTLICLDGGLEREMAQRGGRAVIEALENGQTDFFKDMGATNFFEEMGASKLKQKDVLKRLCEKFDEGKKQLTVNELILFFQNESERSKGHLDRLYYACISAPHKSLNQLWSFGSGIISSLKAQPLITHIGYFLFGWEPTGVANIILSTGVSVVITGGQQASNDELRPYIKPPKGGEQSLASQVEVSRKDFDLKKSAAELLDNVTKVEAEACKISKEGSCDLEGNHAFVVHHSDKHQQAIQDAYKTREDFVRKWIDGRIQNLSDNDPKYQQLDRITQELKTSDEQQKQHIIDRLLTSDLLNDIDDSMVAAHRQLREAKRSLDQLQGNSYVSKKELEELQKEFKKRRADLLSFEVEERSPQNPEQIERIWRFLAESQDSLKQRVNEMTMKVDGGNARVDVNADQLQTLKAVKNFLTTTRDAYEQLAQAYLLKYKNHEKEKLAIQQPLFEVIKKWLQEDSMSHSANYITTCGRRLDATNDEHVSREAVEDSINLLTLFIENKYGLNGVAHFQCFIADKKSLSIQEFKNFIKKEKEKLAQEVQGQESKAEPFYISSRHSGSDLLPSSEEEKNEMILSNGENTEDYLIDKKSIAAEGVRATLQRLIEMDWYKNKTALQRINMLESYKKQFQDEGSKTLTRGAFKQFLSDEEEKQQQWGSYLYYLFLEPSRARWWWGTGFMGTLSALRVMPPIQHLGSVCTFGLTYTTDVGGELSSLRREKESYEKSAKEREEEMLGATKQEPVDDLFYSKFKKTKLAVEEEMKKARNEKNYLAWRIAIDKYEKVLKENKGDMQKKIAEKLNVANFNSETVNPFITEALNQLEASEQSLTELSHSFQENPFFSKENVASLQTTVADFKENFLLQQSRSTYDPAYQMEQTQSVAANNAMFFKQKANKIRADIEEMKKWLPDNASSIDALDSLGSYLDQFSNAYDQLADAYAIKSFEPPKEVSKNLLSQIKEAKQEDAIITWANGTLIIKDPHTETGGISEKDSYDYGARLIKLAIFGHYGPDELKEFEDEFQCRLALINKIPLKIKEVQAFLHSKKEGYVVFAGHSLEELFHQCNSEAQGPITILKAEYNPFSKKSLAPAEKINSAQIFEEFKKTTFFKNLTSSNQHDVEKSFENKFIAPERSWCDWLFLRKAPEPTALTVKEIRSFVQEQEQQRKNWAFFYDICDSPEVSSGSWNIITGLGVTLRSLPAFVACTLPYMTMIPWWAHWAPSFVVAFIINYLGNSWVHLRQLPL